MTKNQIVTLKNYDQLLANVRNQIEDTKNNIANVVTRQKVMMAWQIGKLISEHLSKNLQKDYSDFLFKKLEDDVGLNKTVLYKMHAFHKSYPKLPKDDNKLNWSHYRVLSGVKESDERKYLEDLTKEKSWDSHTLQSEVKKSKISQIRAESKARQETAKPKALLPKRGQLFLYSLVKVEKVKKTCIDCGFGIFRAVDEVQFQGLKNHGQIVETVKKNKNYALKKSTVTPRKLNAYKAYVRRVVDGDTLHVVLDLGFEIYREEKIRLRGINAPEIASAQGKKSLSALKHILKNAPFVILKSTATDVYGRYVGDVFLADSKTESNPQEVADKGIYLNQLLLDKKLVEPFA